MFAFLFTDAMAPFHQNVTSFPTVVFTFFLIVSAFYWLIAVLGMIDIDILDVDLSEPDADLGSMNVLAGLMLKLGLNGVPVTIIVSLIALHGWLISFLGVHYWVRHIDQNLLGFLAEIGVLVFALWISTMITALMIRPIRRFFKHEASNSQKQILGQTLTVRTSRVDANFGEAILEDGGAGLVLKVRNEDSNDFKKGDRVIPIEYNPEKNTYQVISKSEFLGQ